MLCGLCFLRCIFVFFVCFVFFMLPVGWGKWSKTKCGDSPIPGYTIKNLKDATAICKLLKCVVNCPAGTTEGCVMMKEGKPTVNATTDCYKPAQSNKGICRAACRSELMNGSTQSGAFALVGPDNQCWCFQALKTKTTTDNKIDDIACANKVYAADVYKYYSIDPSVVVSPPPLSLPEVTAPFVRLGCYRDGFVSELTTYKGVDFSVSSCQRACGPYTYFGILEKNGECRCGMKLEAKNVTNDALCAPGGQPLHRVKYLSVKFGVCLARVVYGKKRPDEIKRFNTIALNAAQCQIDCQQQLACVLFSWEVDTNSCYLFGQNEISNYNMLFVNLNLNASASNHMYISGPRICDCQDTCKLVSVFSVHSSFASLLRFFMFRLPFCRSHCFCHLSETNSTLKYT